MFVTITTPRIARKARVGEKARHALAVVGDIAAAILVGPLRFYRSRQLVDTMAGMSDHELRDIGLTRQDLADTTALPLTADIGGFLTDRAREHRRRR